MTELAVIEWFNDLIRNGEEHHEAEARKARAAVAELIDADREYDEANKAVRDYEMSVKLIAHQHVSKIYERRHAARMRRAAALARVGGAA